MANANQSSTDSAADLAEKVKEKLDAAEERREAILEEKKHHAIEVAGVAK